MEVLDRSAELLQRGAELRARSARSCAAAAERRGAAAERVQKKRRWLAAAHLDAVPAESEALVRMSQEARARARATREQVHQGRPRGEVLRDSAFARLAARQETMAVIEQAKGIIIARQACHPEEAFDLLRRASQRTNIKVHVLAAQIVEHAAASDSTEM